MDKDVLIKICQISVLAKSSFLEGAEDNALQLDQEIAASLLSHLQNRNARDTLTFAISRTVDFWRLISRLSRNKRKIGDNEYMHSVILEPIAGRHLAVKNLVQEIYTRHKPSGLLEPDAPCLGFSAQLEYLKGQGVTDHRYSLPLEPPNGFPGLADTGAILLYSNSRDYKYMCVFITKDTCDLAILTEVMSALIETMSEGRFFVLGNYTVIDKDTKYYGKGPHAEGELILLIKTAAQLWGMDLLLKIYKEHSKDDYLELYSYDEAIRKSFWKTSNALKWQPFSGPLEPEPEHEPRKKQRNYGIDRSVGMATLESDSAELEAILKNGGWVRFKEAFSSASENFNEEVVTID
ncbi:hypothetical protein DL95DRAFT_411438 [Leptodontidium sp. 2 PMI_412]|nr:hypothetical protein DL95DRAFT_411438 [Leptodontidium sp. 2 PMI_412]